MDHFRLSVMCMLRKIKLFTLSSAQSTWLGVCSLLFSEVHNLLLCFVDVEGEVIFLAPLYQGPHLLPEGGLDIVGNQNYHCCVTCKLDDSVGDMHGHVFMGKQGLQEGAEHAPLWGPHFEGQ